MNSEQLESADRYILLSLLDDLAEAHNLQRIRVLHKWAGGPERAESFSFESDQPPVGKTAALGVAGLA